MELKLIPRESPEINFQIKPLNHHQQKNSFFSKIAWLKKKLLKEKLNQDDKVIHLASLKLCKFLEDPIKYNSLETGHLIDYLYRTILSLQRKKHKLLENEKDKDKKRKK